jgi:membrane protein required for colicin V production
MTWVDYVILLIIGLSLLLSFWRGAVRELFSLIGWLLAYFAATHFADDLMPWLPAAIPSESLRMLTAYVAVFAGVVLLVAVLGITLSGLLKLVGLGIFDRFGGAVIGVLRGLLIVLALTLAAGLTSLPQTPAWRNAMFSPVCEVVALGLKPLLPASLAKNIRFE